MRNMMMKTLQYTGLRGCTDKMKRNNRYNSLLPMQGGQLGLFSSLRNRVGKVLLTLCLLLASAGAWAADYVLTYTTNGGTTYYLARNGTTGVQRVNTFNPTTCIWSCENAQGAAGTIGNNTTYGWLYQTVSGTKYYLKHGGTVGLTTTKSINTGNRTNNATVWRTNGTYLYNYYQTRVGTTNTNYTYFINLQNGVASATTSSNTCARPYQVDTDDHPATGGISITATPPTINDVNGTSDLRTAFSQYTQHYVTYNFKDADHNWYGNADHGDTTPTPLYNLDGCTYEWTMENAGGYATLNANPNIWWTNVTYSAASATDRVVTVKLTASNAAYDFNQEVTATVTLKAILATYNVTVNNPVVGGTISTSTTSTQPGSTVILTATPNAGYVLASWSITNAGGTDVKSQINFQQNGNSATFTMPAYDVTVSATFVANAVAPTITFNNTTGKVTLSSTTPGAVIYYTTNGSNPTSGSTRYNQPFDVTNACTVKAITTADGYANSTISSLDIPKVATPTISMNAQDKVEIACTTPGATIYYKIGDSGAVNQYSAPITVAAGQIVYAYAMKTGSITSEQVSYTVEMVCDKPVISKVGDNVEISCSHPSNAIIRYTTDGNEPTNTSTQYNGAINTNGWTLPVTVKAKAFAYGYTESETATYVISDQMIGGGTAANPYIIMSSSHLEDMISAINDGSADGKYYKVDDNVNELSAPSATTRAFTGTFDGNYAKIIGLSHALFSSINGGTVKNVRLEDVSISGGQDVGAIANTATGNSKIYNCGVLSGTVSGSRYVGGIVGSISGAVKVVNNYNYASVNGGTSAAGIVGYLSTPQAQPVRVRFKSNGGLFMTEYNGNLQIRTDGNDGYPNYQYWDLEPMGSNSFKIKNSGRGEYIAQSTGDTWTAVFNATGDTYTLSKQSDGTFYINRADGRGFGTDTTTNGSTVYTDKQNANRMNWTIEPADALDQIGSITLMVANCVNYSTEISGTNKYPVYGGNDLDNKKNPLYDFFLYAGEKSRTGFTSTNSAIPVEERFLNRFEYVRATLNAERKLAEYYLFNTFGKAESTEIGKWVLDKEIAPYPIIKPWGKYPSLVNPDVSGRSVGSLSVSISGGPTVSLPISDQLEEEYDYGYHKVQLPYYNDYFNNNYQSDRVVTGWEITSVSGGTAGSFTRTGNNAYNFADRECTQKDLYSVSGRVFAQGGYYYVPEGVTSITITPHWATDVVYVSETTLDKVFGMGYAQSDFGPAYQPTFNVPTGARVYNTFLAAHDALQVSNNVYDHAIVLLSNSNHRRNGVGYNGSPVQNTNKAYTLMSIDEDGDNEPDYCQFYGHVSMEYIPPTRLDFVHQVGISWAKKPMGESLQAYSGIAMTRGHYEITETAFARFTEFETAPTGQYITPDVDNALIFNAGLIDQFVMTRSSVTDKIKYAIVGGHTYFNAYTPGSHATNNTYQTKLFPVSVMGGEYEEFYLTGRNANANAMGYTNNHGRIYTNGGKIGTFAGGYWEQLNGNAIIRFDHTKVGEFYGGSINPAKPITGNIDIIINNCDVDFFCAGPKAGNMTQGKTVTTVANNTRFGTYVGAGYGGSSVARVEKVQHVQPWKYSDYKQTFFNDYFNTNYLKYVAEGDGILIRYAIEYMPASGGEGGSTNPTHVLRFSNDYAQLSLARTYNVTSELNGCEITGNFYGGPWSGTVGVNGGTAPTVTSTLKDCTVGGSVFGGGKSAEIPKITVYPKDAGSLKTPYYDGNFCVYYQQGEDTFPVYPAGTEFSWIAGERVGNAANKTLGTNVDLTNLGTIFGNTDLTIDGGNIAGNVFGAGDASKVMGTTDVVIKGNAHVVGSVYGGANEANVGGDSQVNVNSGTIGNVFGANNVSGTKAGAVTVNINQDDEMTTSIGNVYGGGNLAAYTGSPMVNINNGTVTNNVFGGGKGVTAVVVGDPVLNVGTWPEKERVTVGGDVFGGGDLAAVEGACKVTIRDCNTVIMGNLYGGGNAAPVYSTNTTMWGGSVGGNVFGGGNGEDATKNPNGAQVGYQRDDTTAGGTGNAQTYIYGGTVGTWNDDVCDEYTGGIFGGSNTNGNIRGKIELLIDKQTCTEPNAKNCPIKVKEIYGAGNQAAYDGTGIEFTLGCVDALDEIYGGAKEADLNKDVFLTIRSGTFKRVFGGNNLGGKLNGSITVNIEETGCNPIVIDEIYGGGNQAGYSVYGYEDDLDGDDRVVLKETGIKQHADPVVNIYSCTRIGQVFGGGYGASAVVVGSPTVNVEQVLGDHAAAIEDKLGTIGTIYGGGNMAMVKGDTHVNIGILQEYTVLTGTDKGNKKPILGANITGNVFGGGNNAEVTGKTNVVIGADKQ